MPLLKVKGVTETIQKLLEILETRGRNIVLFPWPTEKIHQLLCSSEYNVFFELGSYH